MFVKITLFILSLMQLGIDAIDGCSYYNKNVSCPTFLSAYRIRTQVHERPKLLRDLVLERPHGCVVLGGVGVGDVGVSRQRPSLERSSRESRRRVSTEVTGLYVLGRARQRVGKLRGACGMRSTRHHSSQPLRTCANSMVTTARSMFA